MSRIIKLSVLLLAAFLVAACMPREVQDALDIARKIEDSQAKGNPGLGDIIEDVLGQETSTQESGIIIRDAATDEERFAVEVAKAVHQAEATDTERVPLGGTRPNQSFSIRAGLTELLNYTEPSALAPFIPVNVGDIALAELINRTCVLFVTEKGEIGYSDWPTSWNDGLADYEVLGIVEKGIDIEERLLEGITGKPVLTAVGDGKKAAYILLSIANYGNSLTLTPFPHYEREIYDTSLSLADIKAPLGTEVTIGGRILTPTKETSDGQDLYEDASVTDGIPISVNLGDHIA